MCIRDRHGLLQDGIHAALAKKHGANVQAEVEIDEKKGAIRIVLLKTCLLYTSDAADERSSVDLGGRRIIKKKKQHHHSTGINYNSHAR